jgi:hypothetical protein
LLLTVTGSRYVSTWIKLHSELGRAQIFKSPGGILQLGIEAADAEPDQGWLQAHRLQAFLKFKPLLWHKTRQSLQARIAKLKPSVKLTSKRINEKAMLPQCNYGSQAYPLSR